MTERDGLTNEERAALIIDALPHPLSPTEAADLALLTRALADPGVWTAPSRELEDVVVQAVLDARPSTLAPVTAIGAAAPSPRRTRKVGRWRIAAAAAAAIAAFAGGAGVVTAGREPHADFASTLSATTLAPNARASAHLYRTDAGFRVELDAHELPTLAGGAYFQAWLRNPDGTLVPIGTFSSSAGEITLWSGVSPEEYRILSVTIETVDDNRVPSGRRVLVGEVHDA